MVGNYWGVEIGYLDLGRIAREGGKTRAQGLNLSLVGKAPLASSFGVFGRLGTTYGRTETIGLRQQRHRRRHRTRVRPVVRRRPELRLHAAAVGHAGVGQQRFPFRRRWARPGALDQPGIAVPVLKRKLREAEKPDARRSRDLRA